MNTRSERIAHFVDTNGRHAGWALLHAIVLGPLGYCYVRPLLGSVLATISAGIACVSFLSPWPPIPVVIPLGVIGTIWLGCACMAPFDAHRYNEALRAEAELIAPFDPGESGR